MTFAQMIHFVISEAVRFVTPIALASEWILVAAVALLVLSLPLYLGGSLAPLERLFAGVARRPVQAVLVCAVAPIALRLLLLPIVPVPVPSIHDEFSHLLLADTLAHGRLTNPTPAMWRHFESIHIIQRPSYNSMYPPAQGIFLAFGQVFFHEPWAGVELGIALLFAAMYWMFLGWLPRAWALFGVCIGILKLALIGFWVNSYMGGSVPAIGGALVVGSLPRLKSESARPLHSLAFGTGAAILLNSRPFEGGVLCAAIIAFLLPGLYRKFGSEGPRPWKRLVLPGASVLLASCILLGFYCYRVTGRTTRLPYQVNRSTYGWPENLAILPPKKIHLQDHVLQEMYELEVSHHDIYKTMPGLVDNLVTRAFDNWAYLLGPLLTLPFLLPIVRWERKARILVVLLAGIIALNFFQLLLYPYHLAPVIPVMFCLVAMGCQIIYEQVSRLGRGHGYMFAVLLPLSLIAVDGLKLFADDLEIPASSYWERGFEWHRDARLAVLEWLNGRPGNHLIIVRYAPEHPVNQEWVYNGADLEGSKVIWARELDKASNMRLLRYYAKREPWLLEADVYPPRVVPYPFLPDGSQRTDDCTPCGTTGTHQ